MQKRRPPPCTRPAEPPDAAVRQVYRTTLFDTQRTAIGAEEPAQIEAAFERMPETYREALTLYRIVGVPLSDIAWHVGRTEAATKMLLSRAMARLALLLPGAGARTD